MLYIGIDLGTSGVKLLLMDEKGTMKNTAERSYPLHFPRSGWSEQQPQDWWDAVIEGGRVLIDGFAGSEVAAICCVGQMHGLVALDRAGQVIRPAILWNDDRAAEQAHRLNTVPGKERLCEITGNAAFAGFTVPKLLWMYENEEEAFRRIEMVLLPKDYINYRLTGAYATDRTDAGGTLLLDVHKGCWSEELTGQCGLQTAQLPRIYGSHEVIGTLQKEAAEALGLSPGIPVVAGAGDNAAAAVGMGTLANGACNISIGTSGTVFVAEDTARHAPNGALHLFPHANGKYHLLGCMLSAASSLKWFCGGILETENIAAQQRLRRERLGKNDVWFLPYLMGERCPIDDPHARGVFAGMTLGTTREDMLQAVMEGVAFAIRDNLEQVRALGIPVERAGLCGGGARSELWRTIFANVLDLTLEIPKTERGPAYGAAMLAMVGCGQFATVEECCATLPPEERETVRPERELTELYERQYQKYRELYPALAAFFSTRR